MHPELKEALDLHKAIVAEAGNALIGYENEKTLANVVLLSEIPTTYDKDAKRQWLELAEKWSELAESARIQPQFRYIPPKEL